MLAQFKTFPQLLAAFPTEQAAVDHFTSIRWANGKFCPLCGCADEAKISRMSKRMGKDAPSVLTNQYKCYACREKFSIRVGTIFQDTKLPLRTWFAAIWMITNHPKGIASTTLATDLGITQKSAWHVLHRLRNAARTDSFSAPLEGEVEVDETYVGGKAANRHKGDPKNQMARCPTRCSRMKGRKLEPPFYLDLATDEALERFIQTRPEEVEPPRGRRRKTAKPAPEGAPDQQARMPKSPAR